MEAVLILQKQKGESAVRSVDLARHMGFSKPSISHAVGVLKSGGFLTVDGRCFFLSNALLKLRVIEIGIKSACL